jgi:hypothetical protein
MPKGPKGEKRPADVIGAAVMVAKIATGEIKDREPQPEEQGKDPGAVALGRKPRPPALPKGPASTLRPSISQSE